MLRVFCDFDGTVSSEDVGNRLFRHFAGGRAEEIVQGYLTGVMTAADCLSQECAAAGNVPPEVLAAFVDQFELDPGFPEFVRFCKQKEIPLAILSDGLDFYVERVLRNHGFDGIPWCANHLEFKNEDGITKMIPSFPHSDSECPQCGNCKRNHMLTMSSDEDIIVYVGDGISDRCPARYADIVFAKRSLLTYCQQQNITFHQFSTFRDVQSRLENILQQKRIRKRREAEMARRDAYMQG